MAIPPPQRSIRTSGCYTPGILSLAEELAHPGFANLTPQAAGNSWYPLSFVAPVERNEPHLSSALAALSAVLDDLGEARIPLKQTILLGFSQGACLVLEFTVQNARRFGGIVGLSGGLIGPPGEFLLVKGNQVVASEVKHAQHLEAGQQRHRGVAGRRPALPQVQPLD